MSKGTCKLDGCEKPRIYRLYCHMHQARLRKTGSPGQAESTVMHTDGTCSVEGCETPIRCKGLCEAHYSRWVARGTLEPYIPAPKGECKIGGCDRTEAVRGLCRRHYDRLMQHGDAAHGGEIRTKYATAEEAFKARTVRASNGCLLWEGAIDECGYGHITIHGRDTLVHRYAWERRHGPIPDGKRIDHMLGCDTACCEVEHLRVATHRQNCQHRVRQDVRNTSGHRGVSWRDESGVWVAQIGVDGRSIYLGQFPEDQLELAAETARAARVEYFGEFAGTV